MYGTPHISIYQHISVRFDRFSINDLRPPLFSLQPPPALARLWTDVRRGGFEDRLKLAGKSGIVS